ncbi:hypothetical protein F5880DRAFT_1504063 [Lentinula raphanica]|nr:hypothetical protein F5880DRAFT_1504063 [Lentinula raphanica]
MLSPTREEIYDFDPTLYPAGPVTVCSKYTLNTAMRFITTLLPFITLVVRVAATDIPLDNLPVPPLAADGPGSENHRAEIQPYGRPTTPPSAYLPAHRVHDVDPAHGNPSSVIHLPNPPDGTYLEPPPTYAQAVASSLPPDGGAFVPSTPQLESGYHLGLRMSQEQAQATGASRVAVVLVSRFPQLERYMDNLPYKLGIGCILCNVMEANVSVAILTCQRTAHLWKWLHSANARRYMKGIDMYKGMLLECPIDIDLNSSDGQEESRKSYYDTATQEVYELRVARLRGNSCRLSQEKLVFLPSPLICTIMSKVRYVESRIPSHFLCGRLSSDAGSLLILYKADNLKTAQSYSISKPTPNTMHTPTRPLVYYILLFLLANALGIVAMPVGNAVQQKPDSRPGREKVTVVLEREFPPSFDLSARRSYANILYPEERPIIILGRRHGLDVEEVSSNFVPGLENTNHWKPLPRVKGNLRKTCVPLGTLWFKNFTVMGQFLGQNWYSLDKPDFREGLVHSDIVWDRSANEDKAYTSRTHSLFNRVHPKTSSQPPVVVFEPEKNEQISGRDYFFAILEPTLYKETMEKSGQKPRWDVSELLAENV